MNSTQPLLWTSASRSHVGMVRKVNEDACLELPEHGLWAVADGMGGHTAGDVASQMIVDALQQLPPLPGGEAAVTLVKHSLQAVNRRLQAEAAQHYQHRTMGSTVAILLADAGQCTCLWVGDSRVYRLRDGQLTQLTRDHSEVQELLDKGLLKPEQARNHPLANVITRAVGAAETLEIDALTLPLQANDTFLLCSDGLTKTVTDEEIAGLLAHSNNKEVVQALIHLALVRGADDNTTVVVVHIHSGDSPPAG